jgi:O-antigen ligase
MVIMTKNKKLLIASGTLVAITLTVLTAAWVALSETPLPVEGAQMNPLDRIISAIHPKHLEPTSSSNFRLFLLKTVSVKILESKPVLGMGLGSFGSQISKQTLQPFYQDFGISKDWMGMVVDVQYATIIAQTGFLGLFCLLVVLFSLCVCLTKITNNSDDTVVKGIGVGLLGFIAAAFMFNFAFPFIETRTISVLFWFAIATIAVMAKESGFVSAD